MKENNLLKSIAIIPARKNSKRIKNKNIKNFFNKPLIAWTIKNALKSKIFSEIYVSTDSKKIAKISEKFGAKVLYPRPKHLSNDKAKLIDVMKYEIKNLLKKKKRLNFVFCILPGAIFLKKQHYLIGLKKINKKIDFVMTATKNDNENIKNFYFKKNKFKLINPEFENFMTQEIPQTYKDAAQFYFADFKTWLKKKSVFTKKTKIVLLNKKNTIDIDNLSDWKNAKKIFKR